MFIQTEATPNPDSLKFIPGQNISNEPQNFLSNDDAINSPLAQHLFKLEAVKSIFLGYDFITVTKKAEFNWEIIKAEVLVAIMDFLISGDEIFNSKNKNSSNPDQSEADTSENSKIIQEIKEIIETRVRPSVMQDGGDIVFHDFKEGVVRVELHGACSGCPSSTVTLKNGIENMLKYYIPEVIAVESI